MIPNRRTKPWGDDGTNRRILLCDTSGRTVLATDCHRLAANEVDCLDSAVEWAPDVIVVRFPDLKLERVSSLVTLCAALKRNTDTGTIPILAVLRTAYRPLMQALKAAGVEFVRFIAADPVNPEVLENLTAVLGSEDRIDASLARLCPYMHFIGLDVDRDMPVCGAYLDRLVLNSRRLRNYCESEAHLKCGYFCNPRPARPRSELA